MGDHYFHKDCRIVSDDAYFIRTLRPRTEWGSQKFWSTGAHRLGIVAWLTPKKLAQLMNHYHAVGPYASTVAEHLKRQ